MRRRPVARNGVAAMTSVQKRLKIISFVLIAMCIVLAAVDSMAFAFANTSMGLLQAIIIGVAAVLDAALGVFGIGAANRPSRAELLFPLATIAAVVNIFAALVLVMLPGVYVPNVVNCAVVCLHWHFLKLVRAQALA